MPAGLLLLLAASLACPLPGEELFQPGVSGPAQLVVLDGVALARLQGTPGEIGTQLAGVAGQAIRRLLAAEVSEVDAGALARIPAAYRVEVTSIAQALDLDPARLATADLIADRGCSAIVHADAQAPAGGSMLVARNLDFAPADLIGPGTLVEIVRGLGLHAFASVTWPGYGGVVSGINDAGVVACLLLNLGHPHHQDGEPVSFRLREMLERSDSLAAAVRIFSATPVSSGHFVLLADAQNACVLWQDGGHLQRQDLAGGWLTCTNQPPPPAGQPADARTRFLEGIEPNAVGDAPWMRRALTGCYLTGINAQAMLLVPGRLELQLSLGTATSPAALGTWHAIPLLGLMHGASFPPITRIGAVPDRLRHYDAP